MAIAEHRNHARAFLTKAEEYLASAEDSLAAERYTPASGNAIHAGISAKDAIVTALTGTTSKGKDHATAARELRTALGQRENAVKAIDVFRGRMSRSALWRATSALRRRSSSSAGGRWP